MNARPRRITDKVGTCMSCSSPPLRIVRDSSIVGQTSTKRSNEWVNEAGERLGAE